MCFLIAFTYLSTIKMHASLTSTIIKLHIYAWERSIAIYLY